MAVLTQQRCFEHPEREAASRCPGCRRYFYRECVTEHDGRVTCQSCLRKAAAAAVTKRRNIAPALALFGFVTVWFFFYGLGELLVLIPSEVHDPGSRERRQK